MGSTATCAATCNTLACRGVWILGAEPLSMSRQCFNVGVKFEITLCRDTENKWGRGGVGIENRGGSGYVNLTSELICQFADHGPTSHRPRS